MRSLPLIGAALLALLPSAPARANWPLGAGSVGVTGFLQPGFDYVHDDPQTQTNELGFTLGHARLLGVGEWHTGKVTFDARLEIEGTPQFSLFDAWVDAKGPLRGDGAWRLVAGQHKAPFSRQILVWEPRLQMLGRHPDGTLSGKSWVTELAPGHQLGFSGTLNVPYAKWLVLSFGAFNGKGRNHIENVDQNFMYVGRIEAKPIGTYNPLLESALVGNELSFAADFSYNVQNLGDYDQTDLLFGGDAYWAFRGFSIYGEFAWGSTQFTANKMAATPPKNYHSLGYNVQAGYLLPIPGRLYRRFEVVAQFQGILRNDAIPLAGPGDPNQTHYAIVTGLNYFQWGHSLKVQANYQHYLLPNDTARMAMCPGKSGTFQVCAESDAVIVQATYILE